MGTTLVSTRLVRVVFNHLIENQKLMSCSREEAGDSLLIQVKELSFLGYRKITAVTLDTDAVVIVLYAFSDIYSMIEELRIDLDKEEDKV